MKRAAILPYPGDPFLLNYWLKFFENYWWGEVDKLYIYLNSAIESEVVDYIKNRSSIGKVTLIYEDHQLEHGEVINKALDLVEEELIMLVEDDGFIFKEGQVNSCFEAIESGKFDIVGSKRGSCAMEILTRAQNIWGLQYEGEGDQGPNFWPNFFFCSKELLLKTDRNFAAKAWKKGDIIEALGNYQIQDEISNGDTFVNTSLQLRAMVPIERILCLPQYHGHPDDIDHYNARKYLFDGYAPWTHVGSLSSGVGGALRDDKGRALARRKIDKPGDPHLPLWANSPQEKNEWERRVQWWSKFYEESDPNEIKEFRELYGEAVEQIIRQFGLNRKNIELRKRIYATLGL